MAAPSSASLGHRLPLPGKQAHSDELLEAFLGYAEDMGLELYSAQEEAVLEVFSGHNVVLNTPTGSGKSLVALAACFKALSEGGVAYYTAPIKALVSEKFFELCRALGPANVGMMTGDATVNPTAPLICCTAEILANRALREGERTRIDWAILDEFHYYADRDRGGAWQIPLIALPQARFLLMSATLGNTEFFVDEIGKTTGAPCALVSSRERPVPLDFEYSETPLQRAVEELVEGGRVPVYIVHFSQRAASEQAQNLMSLNFLGKEEKQRIKDELAGFRFDSPFGKELSRYVRHGVGVHHAGMLPKYRRLCERLAQQGLLRVICGTDTLGVGVNVPIRTVLFTQLCKFDGKGTGLLSVRDFQQIAGRAGRRGFDTRGTVMVQAPEHEIENKLLRAKAAGDAKKQKKLRLKSPPERGYAPWNEKTLERLRDSDPEPLTSSLDINHGMLLNVLAGERGCQGAKRLVSATHEPPARQRRLMRRGLELLRSLVDASIVSIADGDLHVDADLQQDFSLNQALSLYAVETINTLDREAADYPLVLLSVVESILESPWVILYKQIDYLKGRKLAELKAAGVEYEERMEELAKIDYPKPEAEFIYESFNLFAKHHPWVAGDNIAPKSIARDMHERAASINDYVKEYGLSRAEGVLLRYLSDVYRALRQTVPEACKTEDVWDLEEWLGAELRIVDASLLEEWERLQRVGEVAASEEEAPAETPPDDITSNQRAFTILIKNACWRVVQALARRDYERVLAVLTDLAPEEQKYPKDPTGEIWTAPRLEAALGAYWQRHDAILLDADARSHQRFILERRESRWLVRQVLSDPEQEFEWALRFEVDSVACRVENRLLMSLVAITDDPAE